MDRYCKTFLSTSNAPRITVTRTHVDHEYFDDKHNGYDPPVGHLHQTELKSGGRRLSVEIHFSRFSCSTKTFSVRVHFFFFESKVTGAQRTKFGINARVKSGLFCFVFKVSGDRRAIK